jgi:hypothetical protein
VLPTATVAGFGVTVMVCKTTALGFTVILKLAVAVRPAES